MAIWAVFERYRDCSFHSAASRRKRSRKTAPEGDGARFSSTSRQVISGSLPSCGGGLGWGGDMLSTSRRPPTPALPRKGGGRKIGWAHRVRESGGAAMACTPSFGSSPRSRQGRDDPRAAVAEGRVLRVLAD